VPTEDDIRFDIDVKDRSRVADGRPSAAEESLRRPPTTAVGTLDRALDVLSAVERGGRTYTDIVSATGMTRPTAHRMIRALEDHGLLMQVGGHGYALGPRLLRLAEHAMRNLPLRDLAHPALERLARTTGESAQLYVRDQDRRLCVDSVQSSNELRTIVEIGASLPIAKGSGGKVFLAWSEDGELQASMDNLPDDEGTRLARMVATTKRRGWADSIGEREEGVASVSAPVFDGHGTLVAVVSVSGPSNRIGQLRGPHYAPAVMTAAREVEAAIGGTRT